MEENKNPHTFPIPQVSTKRKHYKWSYEEDRKLIDLVNKYSSNPNWDEISAQFPNRNTRQCQERWSYYLSPDVNNGPWTKEEDELLLEKYREFGSRWVHIAQFFKGRTNTNCKNRYLAINRAIAKGEKLNYYNPQLILPPPQPVVVKPIQQEFDLESSPFDQEFEIFDSGIYPEANQIDFYW